MIGCFIWLKNHPYNHSETYGMLAQTLEQIIEIYVEIIDDLRNMMLEIYKVNNKDSRVMPRTPRP